MYRSDNDIMEFIAEVVPIMEIMIPILLFVLIIAYFVLKNADNKKELITKKVTILEKLVQNGNVAWYIVECENGERIRLRNLQANRIIIAVGDKGIMKYRGQTIQSFER